MKYTTIFLGQLFFLLLVSCQSSHPKPAEIIRYSVDEHGGWDAWKQLKTMHFTKKTMLFDREGVKVDSTEEKQIFSLQPQLSGEIRTSHLDTTIQLIFNGTAISKVINGHAVSLDAVTSERLKNKFLAAQYVACQPFKLLEKGVIHRFVGIEKILDTEAYAIAIQYESDTETSDKWTYYFDCKNYRLLATKVIHGSNGSIIFNTAYDDSTPFLWNSVRESYRTDTSGNTQFLLAKYYYSDFVIKFLTGSKK